jgi:NADPH:quinone reductase-like Zn-dependent oxidoreductase
MYWTVLVKGDGPEGYDIIVDVVAGPAMPSFFARLNSNGRMVVVGVVGGYPPADFGMRLFAAASRGELELVVHEVLPLEQAVLAHQKMDAGEVFGRIVLVPSSS